MKLLNKENVEINKYKLEIEVSPEAFDAAVEEAYKKEGKKMSVQGFRKGKAPRKFIEKVYGETVFYDAAIDSIYRPTVMEAVDASELEVVSIGQMDIKEVGKEKGLLFTLEVITKPEVKIENYKGIEVEAKSAVVTDEEVEDEIGRVRDRNARIVSVEDAAAKKGDIAVIDYEGFVDEVAFAGGKGEGHELTLGSGQFIPGFEEQVEGHNVGEEFDVTVKFPEEYHAEDLKGKEAVFKVKINEIKTKELPEADDEFAKDVSEFDTLAEYKADIKAKFEERNKKAADAEVDRKLMDAVAEKLEAVIPNEMIENEINESLNQFAYRLQSQGLDIQTYLKYTGQNPESMREQFKGQAEMSVKVRLALEEIVKMENIEVSEDEMNEEFEKLSKAYNMPLENVKNVVREADLKTDVAIQKAVTLIKDNAVIKEVE